MAEGEETAKLTLCPIGLAASQAGTELIESVLANTPNDDFRNEVRTEREWLAKAIEKDDPDSTPASIENESLAYATGAIVHKRPARPEGTALTGIECGTAAAISIGADMPGREVGQALICALGSEHNTLKAEYQASYGTEAQPGTLTARTNDS